jgi:uncharacterized protein
MLQPDDTPNNPFRILSIDGGGLRGIVPVKILQWIEREITKKPIYNSFDLFAGTSTGGLICCALTLEDSENIGKPKFSLEDIEDIYKNSGKHIFPPDTGLFAKPFTKITGLFKPKFSEKGLQDTLNKYFSGKRVGHCIKPILIPTYDIKHFDPIFFCHRFLNPSSKSYNSGIDKNAFITDICRSTSAAPTYFPPHEFFFTNSSGNSYRPTCIDGGVFLNNPSIAAYVEVLSNASDPVYTTTHSDGKSVIKDRDIHILSIGTGKTSKSIEASKCRTWGEAKWARPLIDIMMQANSQNVHHQLKEMLHSEGRYVRLDINIPDEHAGMTDCSEKTINFLIQQVKIQIEENIHDQHRTKSFAAKARL